MFQAHIINMPVGHTIPTEAKDTVKLPGVKLKLGTKAERWKSVVGIINISFVRYPLILYFQTVKVVLPGLGILLLVGYFVAFLVFNKT